MPNPYHDENGKFCSRTGMLSRIDHFALTGQFDEYKSLRDQFNAIEVDNVTVPKDFIGGLLQQNGMSLESLEEAVDAGTIYAKNKYEKFDNDTLATMVEDLASREDRDNTAEIMDILEASGYDENVIYAAITTEPGLPYETRVALVKNHKPAYFGFLVDSNEAEVYAKNAVDLQIATATLSIARATKEEDDNDTFLLSRMTASIAANAKTEAELDFAIQHAPYGYNLDQQTNREIMGNPLLTKRQALTVFENEIATGGQNYWIARNAIILNFKARGISMLGLPEYNKNVKPLPGTPDQKVIDMFNKHPFDDRKRLQIDSKIENNSTIYDSYDENFKSLKLQIDSVQRGINKNSVADLTAYTTLMHLKDRYNRASAYLNQLDDVKNMRVYLAD